VIQVLEGWDDEQLLTALGEAIKARDAVPSWFVQTGKNAYAWHNVDAELAQLTYDSRTDADEMAVARSETATIRALTGSSPWRPSRPARSCCGSAPPTART
jgi:hypothetical protein